MINLILIPLVAVIAHFATIAASANRFDLIAYIGLFPIVVLITRRFFIKSKRSLNRKQFLSDWVSTLILSSLVLDLLTNVVNFEPNPAARKALRNLLYASLFLIPIVIPLLTKSFRLRLPYFILVLLLFPPAATTSIPRMGYPSYGFTLTIIALLLVLIKNNKRRYNFFLIGEAWLLIPAALIPLLWTFYKEAPITQVAELLLVFIPVMVVIPIFKHRNQLARLTLFLLWFYLPFFFLLLIFPQIFAINSNITSVLIEALIPLSLLLYFERTHKYKWVYAIVSLFLLFIVYKIDARSAFAAILVGLVFAIFAYSLFLLSRKSNFIHHNKGRIFGIISVLSITVLFIILKYLVSSTTIKIRVALWNAVGNALIETPKQLLFGTGGFGYFFHLFQHIKPPYQELYKWVLDIEPWAISHNPHSDYALMLYGGGLIYIGIFIIYTVRTILKSFQTTNPVRTSLLLSIIITLLVHSLTEPLTSTISTSFAFWFVTSLLKINNQNQFQLSDLFTKSASIIIPIMLCFLLIGQIVRTPIQQFWAKNYFIFVSVRQPMPTTTPNPTDIEIENVIHQIDNARLFFPLDFDLLRQQGDLRLYQSIRTDNKKENYNNQALTYYCLAFQQRPIAIYYGSIKRITNETSFCKFPTSVQLLFEGFDPYNLIENATY